MPYCGLRSAGDGSTGYGLRPTVLASSKMAFRHSPSPPFLRLRQFSQVAADLVDRNQFVNSIYCSCHREHCQSVNAVAVLYCGLRSAGYGSTGYGLLSTVLPVQRRHSDVHILPSLRLRQISQVAFNYVDAVNYTYVDAVNYTPSITEFNICNNLGPESKILDRKSLKSSSVQQNVGHPAANSVSN